MDTMWLTLGIDENLNTLTLPKVESESCESEDEITWIPGPNGILIPLTLPKVESKRINPNEKENDNGNEQEQKKDYQNHYKQVWGVETPFL